MKAQHLEDGDYILKDGRAWFTVNGFSVWVRARDTGLSVDIYPLGDETAEPIASLTSDTEDLAECYERDDEKGRNGGGTCKCGATLYRSYANQWHYPDEQCNAIHAPVPMGMQYRLDGLCSH